MGAAIPTVARATQADIDRVAARYELRGEEAITAVLRDHPGVVTTLLEAVDVIPRYFGPDPPLALELDLEGPHVHLYALIQIDLEVDASLDRLGRFDDEWWLDAIPRADFLLTIDVEYM